MLSKENTTEVGGVCEEGRGLGHTNYHMPTDRKDRQYNSGKFPTDRTNNDIA